MTVVMVLIPVAYDMKTACLPVGSGKTASQAPQLALIACPFKTAKMPTLHMPRAAKTANYGKPLIRLQNRHKCRHAPLVQTHRELAGVSEGLPFHGPLNLDRTRERVQSAGQRVNGQTIPDIIECVELSGRHPSRSMG